MNPQVRHRHHHLPQGHHLGHHHLRRLGHLHRLMDHRHPRHQAPVLTRLVSDYVVICTSFLLLNKHIPLY